MEEEQIRSIVRKVLDEQHLLNFIKTFEKEHNIFRGSHDKINLPENLVIPEKIIKYIVESKYIYEKIIQVGALEFIDNFADASRFWAWRLFLGEVSEVGKTGTEEGGKYQLAVLTTKNGKWDSSNNEAPRIFMSPLCFPCEIITRLDDVGTPNDNTFAGLVISKRPAGFGSNLSYAIGRKRDDGESINGICVVENTYSNLATTAITDLPVWLRIRVGCVAYASLNVYFDYSIDGVNWVNLYHQGSGWVTFSIPGVGVGLYVANGADADDSASKNEIVGKFDFFQMKLDSIN